MKKFLLISMLFGFAFSMIACKAGSDDATGGSAGDYTVTFDKDYRFSDTESKTVQNGSKVTPIDDPFLNDHEFVGWSTKTTDYEAFDFSKPVTKDITLYAIYKPILTGTIDPCINGECDFKTTAPYPFVLSDGSLYGIKAYYTINDGEKTDIVLTYAKTNISNVFTYTFEEIENYSAGGKLYITCAEIDGEGEISGDIDPETSKKVKNLKVTVDDSYAKVSFTPVAGYTDYTVTCTVNGESYEKKLNSVVTAQNVEFFGLINNKEHSFTVKTDTTGHYVKAYGTPTITKKKTDNLVIMYMDGDNNLNDPIFMDLNEVEYGLYKIRNSDGTPKTGFQSVNVVALWDGIPEYENNSGGKVTPLLLHPDTGIFEVGTDESNYIQDITDPGCVLSNNTKNLSYTADNWLLKTNAHNANLLTADSYGEVSMSSKSTLVNYLKWVQERYEADHVYLQFSNHGGGPRSNTISIFDSNVLHTKDINNYTPTQTKALCWDDTTGDFGVFLKTKDVSDALTEAGYGASNKLSMLMFDICLGASIEDAYQFRNFADYMVASPNNIPGYGFNYVKFIESFSKTNDVKAIGSQLVDDYMNFYIGDCWSTVAAKLNILAGMEVFEAPTSYEPCPTEMDKQMVDIMNAYSSGGITTLSLIDLAKVEQLVKDINSLGNTIKSKNNIVNIEEKNITYSDCIDFYFIQPSIWYEPGWTMNYEGSFAYLLDVGYMANNIMKNSSDKSSPLYDETVANKANKVLSSCKNAIVKSYRECLIYDEKAHTIEIGYYNTSSGYGITITGGNKFCDVYASSPSGFAWYTTLPSWYKTDLEFGSGDWAALMDSWY